MFCYLFYYKKCTVDFCFGLTIFPIDGILTDATTPDQDRPGNNNNYVKPPISQSAALLPDVVYFNT